MARAVRNAARDVGADRAAEQKPPAAELAIGPAATLVGQFEQGLASGSRGRRIAHWLRLLRTPPRWGILARARFGVSSDISKRAALALCPLLYLACLPIARWRAMVGSEPQAENLAEHRSAGNTAEFKANCRRAF